MQERVECENHDFHEGRGDQKEWWKRRREKKESAITLDHLQQNQVDPFRWEILTLFSANYEVVFILCFHFSLNSNRIGFLGIYTQSQQHQCGPKCEKKLKMWEEIFCFVLKFYSHGIIHFEYEFILFLLIQCGKLCHSRDRSRLLITEMISRSFTFIWLHTLHFHCTSQTARFQSMSSFTLDQSMNNQFPRTNWFKIIINIDSSYNNSFRVCGWCFVGFYWCGQRGWNSSHYSVNTSWYCPTHPEGDSIQPNYFNSLNYM